MIVKVVKGDKKPIICSNSKMRALEQQAQIFDTKEIMSILGILQSSASAMQSGNRRCEMEMAIIRLCNPEIRQDLNSLERRIAVLEAGQSVSTVQPTFVAENINKVVEQVAQEDDEIPLPEFNEPPSPINEENETIDTSTSKQELPNDIIPVTKWGEIICVLRTSCPLIAGVLQDSKAYIQGDRLLIDTNSSQFRELVNGSNPIYRDSIRKAAHSILGKVYKLGPYHAKISKNDNIDPLINFAKKLEQLNNK